MLGETTNKNQNVWTNDMHWSSFQSEWTRFANRTEMWVSALAKITGRKRAEMKQRNAQQVVSDLFSSSDSMYADALTRKFKSTSDEERRAAQTDALAAMVKWRAIEEWYWEEWEWYNTTNEIIWHLLDMNPSQDYHNRIIEYANSDEDPYDFGIAMWILLTPEEQKRQNTEKQLESLFWEWNVPEWLTTFTRRWTDTMWWLSEFVKLLKNWELNYHTSVNDNYSDSDEAPVVWALENYAFRNFWKNLEEWLTEWELYKALSDLQDEESFAEYAPSWWKATTRSIEWVWQGVLSELFPLATAGFSWVGSTDVWGKVLWGVNRYVMWPIWQLITYNNPLLWAFAYNLPTEDRVEWYEFLWQMGIAGLLWTRSSDWKIWKWGKWGWWEWWGSSSIKPMELISKFKDWTKENTGLNKNKKWKQLDTVNKMRSWYWTKNPKWDNQKILTALEEVNKKNPWEIKTYEQLANEIKSTEEELVKEKKESLGKNTNKYGVEETKLTEPDDFWENIDSEPFKKALDALIKDANTDAKVSSYTKYKQAIDDGTITHSQLEKIITDFKQAYWSKAFTNESVKKSWITADGAATLMSEMDRVSQKLADESWIEWFNGEYLKGTNNKISSLIRAKAIFNALANKVLNLRSKYQSWVPWADLLSTSINWFLTKVFKKVTSKKLRSELDSEASLNKWTKSLFKEFDKIEEKAEWGASAKEITKDLENVFEDAYDLLDDAVDTDFTDTVTIN